MSWFRNLISTTTRVASSSSSKPRLVSHAFSYSLLSCFTTEAAPARPAFAVDPTRPAAAYAGGLPATKPGEKPRVVVLGTGWAGCRLMKGLDTKLYDVVCVSPRNHMVFTPLLASTCVGTLEFRSVAEPIGRIQPAISTHPGSYFFLSNCIGLDTDKNMVQCETVTDGADNLEPWKFEIAYDKLVIALGAQPTTFGIRGVEEHAVFLREVYHAQEIRRKLLLNLMLSDVPGVSEEEKSRLLHCVVVGGGPTGVEFSGELSDFIQNDVRQRYSHVKDYIHVTLIEANEILSSFDDRLRHYATNQLTKSGVRLVRGIVKDVKDKTIVLNDGTEVPYGLLVWSTGVGPSSFVKSLQLPKAPGGRIGVDEWLRVPSEQDVFSIGDCCGFLESTGKSVLPALAQVAEREGKYLAKLLNKIAEAGGGHANCAKEYVYKEPFVYKHLGSMATVGRFKALVDLRQSKEAKGLSLAGFTSWFIWRSAYLTRVKISLKPLQNLMISDFAGGGLMRHQVCRQLSGLVERDARQRFIHVILNQIWHSRRGTQKILLVCKKIGVDEGICVPGVQDAVSIGDCSDLLERLVSFRTPATTEIAFAFDLSDYRGGKRFIFGWVHQLVYLALSIFNQIVGKYGPYSLASKGKLIRHKCSTCRAKRFPSE